MAEQKGLTIIELVISIFVLMAGVIVIFGSFSIIAILVSNIEDQLTAVYLGQEGIEIIRNLRDNNWKRIAKREEINWDRGLIEACQDGCMVDFTTDGSLNPILPWNENQYLNIQPDTNFYSYKEGEKTKFRRRIDIIKLKPPKEEEEAILKVVVTVFWDQKPNILNPQGNPGKIQITNTLYNWY